MQYKIIVDKQPSSNPSSEKKEYVIDIEELRVKGDVYDSLNIEMDRTYVTRRLSLSEYGVLSVLNEPVIQELTDVDIKLFEGDNYIYLMDMQGNKFYAEYLIKNDFNDIYVNKNEMNSSIQQTAQSIELSVNQKLTGYSTTQEMNSAIQQSAQSINLSVNEKLKDYSTTQEMNSAITVKANEITSSVSKTYSTKSELNIAKSEIKQTTDGITSTVSTKAGKNEVCSIVSQSAEEILLKGNRVLIESDFYNLSKEGKVTIYDKQSSSATGDTTANLTIITDSQDLKTQITPNRILISGNSSKSYLWNTNSWSYIGATSDNEQAKCRMISAGSDLTFIDCSDGTDTSKITPKEITSPKLTQTSLESIKKNITKFTKNATDIINNSDIYEYNLKSDKDEEKKMIGFVIGDKYRTPNEVIDKEGRAVELYSAIGILWKAVQELSARVEQLEKEAQHE